jgi:peroxiredoxin
MTTVRFVLLAAVLYGRLAAASDTELVVKPGGVFPDLEVQGLLAPGDYAALGLSGREGGFRLTDVPGELLILEFFNRYCLTCWRQAPQFESFLRLAGPGGIEGRARILSVGSGNSAKELAQFRAEHKVTYPLAPDPWFDLYNELGEPGGTPFTVFLRRNGAQWILVDHHVGFFGDVELLARARTILKDPEALPPPAAEGERAALAADDSSQAAEFLSKVAGRPVAAREIQLPAAGRVYQAVADGAPLDLFARVATRTPVCDLCHPIRFAFAFGEDGNLRAFEPLYVTKMGNMPWSEEDRSKFTSRLSAKRMFEIDFDPDVDAVTSATMSSALIYDEVRRTASQIKDFRQRSQ